MRLFSRSVAKELATREPVSFECADWDCIVKIRHLDGAARRDYFKSLSEGGNGDDTERGFQHMYRIVMLTLVDEKHRQVFGEDDLGLISDLPLRGTRQIAERAASLNGLVIEDDEGKS